MYKRQGHDIARRQQRGFGAVVTLELDGGHDAVREFVSGLSCFSLAESLGGVESLLAHPATMTHSAMDPAARARAGLTDGLIRLSVGIEALEDLPVSYTHLDVYKRQPQGAAFERAVDAWRRLPTDAGARFDREMDIDAQTIEPMITYGTNPGMVIPIGGSIPERPGDAAFGPVSYTHLSSSTCCTKAGSRRCTSSSAKRPSTGI